MDDAIFILFTAAICIGFGVAMYSDMQDRSRRGMALVVDEMQRADEHRREHQRVTAELEDLKRRLQACEAKR